MKGFGCMRMGALAVAAAALAGCAGDMERGSAGGGALPVSARGLTWFGYVNGEDLRGACVKGEPDRYRLIYNADYSQHVRTYDITGDPASGGAVVDARVIPAADLAGIDAMDPAARWRAAESRARLSPRQFAIFVLRLYESGAFDPTRDAQRLRSQGVYRLVNGCRGGNWFFSASPYPADRFADIAYGMAAEADPLYDLLTPAPR